LLPLNQNQRTTGDVPTRSPRAIRIEVYLSGLNLLNRANYVGYSGVVTSPFFWQPTNVMNPRKLQAGLRFRF